MRTRSRGIPAGEKTGYTLIRYNSFTGSESEAGSFYRDDFRFNKSSETITDQTNDPRMRAWRANLRRRLAAADRLSDDILRRSVKSDLYTAATDTHPCSHSKTELDLGETVAVSQNGVLTYTHYWSGGYGFTRSGFNPMSSNPNELINWFNSTQKRYSADDYYGPDWFAMLDKWHEACNSLIPSSSLIGESMVEHAVFTDAFKTILNPSRGLKTFLEFAFKFRKEKTFRRKMGALTGTAADTFLGYNFGVKPAISELKNIFEAHQKVSSRLKFLRDNAGGYVPVRVRSDFPSAFQNTVPSTPNNLFRHCEAKVTRACISALAKVRPDLDFADDWKAYVQFFGLHKFLGLAWELVPFSFVLDWVTNAGDYISRYTTPHFASPFYNMRNLCHSVKLFTAEKVFLPSGYNFSEGYGITSGDYTICRGVTSSYTRGTGLPSSSGKVDFSLLGTFHGLASSAMLFQKLR